MVTVFEGDIQYLGFIGRWLLGQTYAYYGNVINSTFGYFALLAESFTYPCGESALLFLCFYGGIAFFGFLGRNEVVGYVGCFDRFFQFGNPCLYICRVMISGSGDTCLYYRRGIYEIGFFLCVDIRILKVGQGQGVGVRG